MTQHIPQSLRSGPPDLNPVVADVTARIIARSAEQRGAYLERMAAAADRGPARGRLACANLAHGFAASDTRDKKAFAPHGQTQHRDRLVLQRHALGA